MRKILFNYALLSLIGITYLSLTSCRKQADNTQPPGNDSVRLTKIIDWSMASFDKDTIPEYAIEYKEGKVVRLLSKYEDTLALNYQFAPSQLAGNYSAPTLSTIVRTKSYFGNQSVDSCNFWDNNYNSFQSIIQYEKVDGFNSLRSLFYSTGTATSNKGSFIDGDNSSSYSGKCEVEYNAIGDIAKIEFERSFSSGDYRYITALTPIYSTRDNSLNGITPNPSIFDPSCFYSPDVATSFAFRGNTFPLSIYYQKRCISGYSAITKSYQNNIQVGSSTETFDITYQFDGNGNVLMILIDGIPYREFIYQ